MRRLVRIVYKLLLSLAGIVLLVIVGALGYEQFNRISAERSYSPEGKILDIAGRDIHYLLHGSGSPTVVFESGLGPYGHLGWFKVEEGVRGLATTISYDRAGILWSDPRENSTSLEAITSDLESLLEAVAPPKPYIVVGHSAAGITLRKFISENKRDIAGIVLVDVSHPEQTLSRPPKVPPEFVMDAMSALGLMRMTSNRAMANTEPADRINQVGPVLIHRSKEGMFSEAAAMVGMSAEAEAIDDFGDIPLIVISATAYKNNPGELSPDVTRLNAQREQFQSDLLNLSTQSLQYKAQNSNHHVQLDEPELVISAIESLITEIKYQGTRD